MAGFIVGNMKWIGMVAAALWMLGEGAGAVSPEVPLLDRVISHPGSYAQVCDVVTAPGDLPYRAYGGFSYLGATFSKANLAEVGKNRDAVVKAIRARLSELDLAREPEELKEDPAPEESFDGEDVGCDPKVLNPLLLELILELKAVEALPELLVVEEKLVKGIAETRADPKAKPPVTTGWFVANENGNHDEKEPDAVRERKFRLFQARVAQRDVVITMARLLRGEKYGPYLATAIEKAYVKGLKAEAKAEGYENYKPGDALPAGKEYLELEIDAVSGVPKEKYFSVAIPYTRESRDEVRAVAGKWISER